LGGNILQKRRLGQTGIDVSVIGLGTVKFGRNTGVKYPTAFQLPDDRTLHALLAKAQALGINFLDTAPAYGLSEERLGKLLQGERKHWIISTKVGEEYVEGKSFFDFSPRAITASIERSLVRLRTDYLDIVLVHSDGNDKQIIEKDETFATLAILKKQGKIRAFGMSTKTIAGGLLTIDHADCAMITFNPNYTAEEEVIQYAARKGKGILVKKALASGHLTHFTTQQAITFALAQNGVTSIVLGTIDPFHLEENVGSCSIEAQ
jgi:aryl-alcohol dehydrogenase-like predicted oxidoreductase